MGKSKIFLIIAIFLFALIGTFGMQYFFSKSSNVTFKELKVEELTPFEHQWLDSKNKPGVYLLKLKRNKEGNMPYIVYSLKKYEYDYHTADVKYVGDNLNINIIKNDVGTESQIKDKLILYIENRSEPKQLSLHLNGIEIDFLDITVE